MVNGELDSEVLSSSRRQNGDLDMLKLLIPPFDRHGGRGQLQVPAMSIHVVQCVFSPSHLQSLDVRTLGFMAAHASSHAPSMTTTCDYM